MNQQQAQALNPKASSSNRRRMDKETGNKPEMKANSMRSRASNVIFSDPANGSTSIGSESSSHDRLHFMFRGLIGLHVEVQVKNGSVYSGIFHETSTEKDFGIILKMARQIKEPSVKAQKLASDPTSKAPLKTFIVPAKDLVQIIVKDFSLNGTGLSNGRENQKQQDFVIDSFISQSNSLDTQRVLEPWIPDKDDLRCPELENIFDSKSSRNWDQFEVNEVLFGVKSTFDEDIYTTKLERGPAMEEREREAARIAREIEREETDNIHLAEERGFRFPEELDLDEESRFSTVLRSLDDGSCEEKNDRAVDSWNDDTFGFPSSSHTLPSIDTDTRKFREGEDVCPQVGSVKSKYLRSSNDYGFPPVADSPSTSSFPAIINRPSDNQLAEKSVGNRSSTDCMDRRNVWQEAQPSELEVDSKFPTLLSAKQTNSSKGQLTPSAAEYTPSLNIQNRLSSSCEPSISSKAPESIGGEPLGSAKFGKSSFQITSEPENHRTRPSSSTSSTAECVPSSSVSTGAVLCPSSSVGSLSSEKSTLNPNAKEFKLNPNAKSFMPTLSSLRPPSSSPEGSFYMANNVPVRPIHGLQMGPGVGHPFGPQPMMYNTQGAPIHSHQAYYPSMPMQYGQQILLGQPGQVVYVPTFPPELPYKGRDY